MAEQDIKLKLFRTENCLHYRKSTSNSPRLRLQGIISTQFFFQKIATALRVSKLAACFCYRFSNFIALQYIRPLSCKSLAHALTSASTPSRNFFIALQSFTLQTILFFLSTLFCVIFVNPIFVATRLNVFNPF